MIQEVIEKIEREIEIRKNMPHNYEQVDICYGLNQAKEIAKKGVERIRSRTRKDRGGYNYTCTARGNTKNV